MRKIIKKEKGKNGGLVYTLECLHCGKYFKMKRSRFNEGRGFYCCFQCVLDSPRHAANVRKGLKRGKDHHFWKGGRLHHQGYVLLMKKDHHRANAYGYVKEHVLVAEKTLGRPLDRNEVIHHINEIRNDNRVQNLYLFESIAAHQSYHINVRYGNRERITESNLPC